MSFCCCSLAGTAACKACSNNPDAEFPPVVRTYTTVATDKILVTGTTTNADKIKSMTVADKIKSMTVDELAQLIVNAIWEQEEAD